MDTADAHVVRFYYIKRSGLPRRLTLRWPPVQREPTFFSAREPFNIASADITLYAQNGVTQRGSRAQSTKIVLTGSGQIQFGICVE